MSDESFIEELANELSDIWLNSEDWGIDEFTETMTQEVNKELAEYRYIVFKASMYHVAQTLVYGGLTKESRSKVIAYLQQQKGN